MYLVRTKVTLVGFLLSVDSDYVFLEMSLLSEPEIICLRN